MEFKSDSRLFDLIKDPRDLPPTNSGVGGMWWQQRTANRGLAGASFSEGGTINFPFNVSGIQHWTPIQTFFRIRGKYGNPPATEADAIATPLPASSQIAPSMGTCANLFQNCQFLAADKEVCNVSSYLPQVDAVENRLSKSGAWLNGTGQAFNAWTPRMQDRIGMISAGVLEPSYSESSPVYGTKLQLGLDAADTVAWTQAQNQITVVTAAVTTYQQMAAAFPPGSYIILSGAAALTLNGQPLKVRSVIAGATVQTSIITVAATPLTNAQANIAASNVIEISKRADFSTYTQVPGTGEYEFLWQPPLAVMKIPHSLPAGAYEFRFTPQPVNAYKTMAVETPITDSASTVVGPLTSAGSRVQFQITEMFLFTALVNGPSVTDTEYLLDLHQVSAKVANLQSVDSYSTYNFNVSPSSYALTVAIQDPSAGLDTRTPSSKFVSKNRDDLKLTRLSVSYAGVTKPSYSDDIEFKAAAGGVVGKNSFVARYAMEGLNMPLISSDSGPESFTDWLERGPLYHFPWPRDARDRSNQCDVRCQFAAGTTNANVRLMLFDHFRSVAKVVVKNSVIAELRIQDA